MSSASVTPPGEWLERLVGVRSSKPTYYAAWRRKSERLDRAIDTLKEISAALCTTTEGPVALCEAVVDAAAHHFSARWAAMAFAGDALAEELPPVIVRYADGRAAREWEGAPAELAEVTGGEAPGALGAPMLLAGERFGTLAVGLPAGADPDESDLAILDTLANQATVAIHIALLFEEAGALAQRSRQLDRARRGLAEARHRGDAGSLEASRRAVAGHPELSEREREVVRLITRGLSNREIGAAIFLSESTVKFHVRNVMRKLGVRHRAEVAYAASRLGLLEDR